MLTREPAGTRGLAPMAPTDTDLFGESGAEPEVAYRSGLPVPPKGGAPLGGDVELMGDGQVAVKSSSAHLRRHLKGGQRYANVIGRSHCSYPVPVTARPRLLPAADRRSTVDSQACVGDVNCYGTVRPGGRRVRTLLPRPLSTRTRLNPIVAWKGCAVAAPACCR